MPVRISKTMLRMKEFWVAVIVSHAVFGAGLIYSLCKHDYKLSVFIVAIYGTTVFTSMIKCILDEV